MPKLLRFMTGHALACVIFLIVSVVPNESFAIGGRHVSQAEWWSSGAGFFASIIGILGLTAGVAIVRKKPWARMAYLCFATIGLVIPYPVFGNWAFGLVGALVVVAAGLYMFKVKAVVAYFQPEARVEVGS